MCVEDGAIEANEGLASTFRLLGPVFDLGTPTLVYLKPNLVRSLTATPHLDIKDDFKRKKLSITKLYSCIRRMFLVARLSSY